MSRNSTNNKGVINNTPKEKAMLKSFLKDIKDKPVFVDKINEINEALSKVDLTVKSA